jgi:hypothetical protein
MSDGLFWGAREVNGVVEFYRADTPTKGAAEYIDTPVVFLRIVDNAVIEKTQEEKDGIIATQIKMSRIVEEQAQNEALMQQECQAEAREAVRLIEANKQLRINALRTSYRNCIREFCELAGLESVDKIEDPTLIINAIDVAVGDTKKQLLMLSMQTKFCLDELRRPSLDGDDAWNRI